MDDQFAKLKMGESLPIGAVSRSLREMDPETSANFRSLLGTLSTARDRQDNGKGKPFDEACRQLDTDPEMIRRQIAAVDSEVITDQLMQRRGTDAELPVPEFDRRAALSAAFDAIEGNQDD